MSISLKIRLNNFQSHHPKLTTFTLIILLAFILTTVFTWPMITKLPVFYSDESDYTLVGWILWYNQLSLTTGRILSSTDYFNAFQFYPWPYSLAFSENLFFPSLIFSPIFWVTNQLVLSVNLYTFSTFILTFIGSFYTFKKIVRDNFAAIIASVIFTFNPVTAAHFPGHTHLLGKFFIPLLFLSAINFLSKPMFKSALLFGLVFSLNALTSINFFIISIPATILTVLPFLAVNIYKLNYRYFIKLIFFSAGFLIFTPLFLHFILPYQDFSKLEGAQRSMDETIFFSARPIDWILPFPESLLYQNIVKFYDSNRFGFPKINYSEHTLGLNLLPVFLFLTGIFFINKQTLIKSKVLIATLFTTILGTFIFTFGPSWGNIKLPYYYFNDLSGLLNGIRVPTRFQFFFYVPFSLIAGLGYLAISERLKIKKFLFFITVLLIITLESFNKWQFISDTSSLTDNPPIVKEYRSFNFLKNTTTLHFPIYAKNFEKQIYYLSLSTLHNEKLMNGYSGYFPPDWVEMITGFETSLDENTLKKLSALKVNYLILHKDRLDQKYITNLKTSNRLINNLVYFENNNYLILALSNNLLSTKKCDSAKNINLTPVPISVSSGQTPTYFNQIKISNTGNCYIISTFNQRYQEASIFNSGKFYPVNIKMPAVLGPKEEILLK